MIIIFEKQNTPTCEVIIIFTHFYIDQPAKH